MPVEYIFTVVIEVGDAGNGLVGTIDIRAGLVRSIGTIHQCPIAGDAIALTFGFEYKFVWRTNNLVVGSSDFRLNRVVVDSYASLAFTLNVGAVGNSPLDV